MKKLFICLSIAALAVFAMGCKELNPNTPGETLYDITVQLTLDNANFEVADISVALKNEAGTSFDAVTDAKGSAAFKVPAGSYSASATYKTAEDGQRLAYNGANASIAVSAEKLSFSIVLNKVVSSQIILKEVYTTGCPKNDGTSAFRDDAYLVLYNNSEFEADATDLVVCTVLPSNAHATNKYYTDGVLLYENMDWLPAYSAIWWFKEPVKIPAYSQIVIACFGAIDHTQTVTASVNLSDPSYYWMSNTDISSVFKSEKYKTSESIPASHYMTTYPVSAGTAWVVSINSPAFYIGKMDKATADALSKDKENYDKTATLTVAKFPQANVMDAIEVYNSGNIDKSQPRFPASLNSGYVVVTGDLGHTLYRNVDKEATEALPENDGKLVYNYAAGTYDEETGTGSTDPSGIDAEASIAAGAHIIYSDTNNSGKDFHERKVQSIKK